MTGCFDEQAYGEGIAAFAAGASLRSVVERLAADAAASPCAEERGMSFAIGFADAALNAIRKAAGQ